MACGSYLLVGLMEQWTEMWLWRVNSMEVEVAE